MRREIFLKQLAAGREKKPAGGLAGDVLIEWSYRVPLALRAVCVLGPVVLVCGYYAYKHYRGVRIAPLDHLVTLSVFVFGSRLAGTYRRFSLTSTGIYELRGTNWRLLGEWEQFESCRREEKSVVLRRRRGYPRALRVPCTEREKLLSIIALANERVERHRWK